jgi:hypothetical protein
LKLPRILASTAVLAGLWMGTLSPASPVLAQTPPVGYTLARPALPISNPGFATNTTGWAKFNPPGGTTTMTRNSGAGSTGAAGFLRVRSNAPGSDTSVYTDVIQQPLRGAKYDASVWVRSPTGAAVSGTFVLWGLGTTYHNGAIPFTVSSTAWQELRVSFSPTLTTHTAFRFQVYFSTPNVNFDIDTASITTVGGLSSLTWRGTQLATGGQYYAIASCTGADNAPTNMSSLNGAGVLRTSTGQIGCGAIPYTIQVSGSSPITASITVGPMPQPIGAVALALDLNRSLTNRFQWTTGTGWSQGCGGTWSTVTGLTGGYVRHIPTPCALPTGGVVGEATRVPTAGTGMTVILPTAQVTRTISSVSVTNSSGTALPIGYAAAAPGTTALVGEMGFVNHPGTHGLGLGFFNVPTGATVRYTETITLADPPPLPAPVPRPCQDISGVPLTELNRGDFVDSCNGAYRLTLQTDGNLVLYRLSNYQPLWHTATFGQAISHFAVQVDGNLVIYRADGSVAWQSATFSPGAHLAVQVDGNLVLYTSAGTPIWQTATGP